MLILGAGTRIMRIFSRMLINGGNMGRAIVMRRISLKGEQHNGDEKNARYCFL